MTSTGVCPGRCFITERRVILFLCKLVLLGFTFVTWVVFLPLPTLAASSHSSNFQLHSGLQQTPQPIATATPGNVGSPQNQQPNENAIASETITTAGVFTAVVAIIIGILGLVTAIATGVGILEANRIRKFRQQFDTELKRLHKEIETESQKFVEASYFYTEGIKEYKAGDNIHAIEHFLQARKYLPDSPRILERLGRAYSNLNQNEKAFEFLKLALDADPKYEPALRSLALYYRYFDRQAAIRLLKQIIENNPQAFETWDFLGLCYRDQLLHGSYLIKDQKIIEKAIEAHEKALVIRERPETEFYLGILLLFSPAGDKDRAKDLLTSAAKTVNDQEHDIRIRDVWKKLIQAGPFILNGKKIETLHYLQNMLQYKPSPRIYIGVEYHLRFLLEGSNHSDWMQEVMDIVNKWKVS